MKPFKTLLTWAFLMLAFVANAQPWTYNFGTGTGSYATASGASTTFFTGTPTGGGTYRVRCGSAGNLGTGFVLANPGTSLGSGSELQVNASVTASTNKYGVYDWTGASTVAYLKAKIRTTAGASGAATFAVALGINTLVSDANGYTSQYNNSVANFWITYASGNISVVNRRISGSTTAITGSGFIKDTDQDIEIYANNGAAAVDYYRSGTAYTLNSQTWDLWVAGVKVSPSNGWPKAGTLASGTALSGFAIFAETSLANAGFVYVDDIEYSNALPVAPPCTAPATQASNLTFPGNSTTTLDLTWTNGDGAGRVIKMNTSNSFTAPTDGSNPTANLNYAGSGEQVIFNGTGTGPITISGLSQNTPYWFQVYEYCSPNRNYQTASSSGNPNSQTTAAGAALSANTLTPFGSQCTGGTYGPNSFTVTGVNLTTADVTITSSLSVYQFSTSSSGPFTSSLTLSQAGGAFSQDVYVQYSPVSAVASSGNIAVSGGGSSAINVAVSGTGIAAAAPTVSTPASTLITYNSATLGASITSINCSDVTVRGIEWSTTSGFTNGTGTIVSESGTFGVGDFTFNVIGLIPNQAVYWKAFATNSSGTTYTTQQTFTTSQQYLSVGDLSVLGFNTTNPDEFVFVNWAPLTRNMVIKFTDNGFNAALAATATGNARGGENFVIWKNNTGADIDPGTVIKITPTATSLGQIVQGSLANITTTDQIFAYQGAALTGANPDWAANGNPTTYTGTILFGVNIGSTGFITTGTATSTSSYLPTELSVANGKIAITGSVAGSQYTATRSALGSILAYRSLVNNPANWTTASTGTITLDLTPFSVNPNVATQIAVTSVNAGVNPSANTPFAVSFETRDANGAAASVGIDTDFAVSLGAGSGAVAGTLTGTITAGSGTLTISGVTYNTAESGVTLTVSSTAGQTLTAGTSAPFTVDSAATYLAFVSLENFLYTGNAAPTFTVQARRNNGTLDVNYSGTATVSLVSGTGTIIGTVSKPIVAGVASFNDIAFDEAGVKQIQVSSGTLANGESSNITVSTATITELLLPQFIEGAQPSNSNRIPFAYRVELGGLKPNSTFRYYNSVVLGNEAASSNGAGNAIYASASGFVRSAGTSLSTAGNYGEFTTNSSGVYAGWFITEPTGNTTRFNPGADVFPRIIMNNGDGGTVPALRLTTANSVRVIDLGTGVNQGTALQGTSLAAGKNFVFVYNNTEGTGRPISGSFLENDGSANSAANSYAAFYSTSVDGVAGAYGMVLPNNLAAGIRRIEGRDLVTGELSGCASTDADGIWPSGVNTVNPNTGTTAKVITVTDAPLVPSPEVCNNYIDDDCDGLIDEACPGNFANDIPSGASLVLYSTNMIYPNCYAVSGNTATANNSAESAVFNGPDSWYRFVAQSPAVSISLTSAAMDNAIAVYSRNGLVYTLVASENAMPNVGDFERLNYSGLTPGQTYYVSVGAASGGGGAFSLCIQHLMPTGCNYAIPAGGFNLCNSYKATYRGSSSQGVTYNFNFTGVSGGATGSTSLTGSNMIVLSNPTLGLKYGGVYDVQINVNYALQDGSSATENIAVLGSVSSLNCNDVTMMAPPEVTVRVDQRCTATLVRGSYLNAARVSNAICGALNYTYRFTQVVSCADATVVGAFPLTFTTTSSSPYLQLTVLPNLGATGAWDVEIRPNFSYGSGLYGPVQRIQVIGTAASGELLYEEVDAEKELEAEVESTSIFPNPSNGESVNVAVSNLQKGQLQVRVLDTAGRSVTTRMYAVEGSLYTTLVFDEKLSAGIYMVEMSNAGHSTTQRLVVQ